MDRDDLVPDRRAARAALWAAGGRAASRSEGGITNRNYRARFGGRDYVIRVPGKDTSLLEIDRGAERIANERAAAIGIAPAGGGDARRAAGDRHRVRRGRGMEPGGPARARDADRRRRARCGRSTSSASRCRPSFDSFRIVETYAETAVGARGRDPGRLRARRSAARAGDRGGVRRARARTRPLPQRPARGQLHPRRRAALDRRLGVRGDGRPLLRPRQLRGQQRARRGRRAGAARRTTSASRRRRAGWRHCG